MITINSNIKQFVKVLEKEITLQNKALVSALNKTAAKGRTRADSAIRSKYNITKTNLNKIDYSSKQKRLGVQKAYGNKFVSKIIAYGQGIPLSSFKAKQNAEGTKVKVKISSPSKTIRGAFLLMLKSSHEGIFVREKAKTILGRKILIGKGSKTKYAKQGRWIRGNVGDPFALGNKRVAKLPIRELFGPGAAMMFDNPNIKGTVSKHIVNDFPEILQDEIRYYTQLKK